MDAHWYRHRWRPRLPQAPPPRSLKAGSAPAAAFAEQAAELGGIKEADELALATVFEDAAGSVAKVSKHDC